MRQSDILKAKTLSKQLSSLGYTSKDFKSSKKDPITPRYINGIDGKTPTSDELLNLILPAIEQRMPKSTEFEITPEVVKRIIEIMHSLPETDKLEVSKGIRNAQSFIYGGTKYGVHEMMHGGSAGSAATNTTVVGEVVAGSGTSFTLAHTPVTGTLALYGARDRLYLTTDYTVVGTAVTTILTWAASDILADYQYA